MAEIINIKNEAGEVQYPVTKPECVIDENGKNVLDLIRENGGGESYDDTELRQEVAELSEKVENINPTPMISVTYAELVALRDNGELIAGMQYRITDFVTTTAQENTRSAGHQFDVIVTADNENTLNEVARACLHEGDTYFSEAGANLAAWQIWYSLDNDSERFTWADAENGKGVIYRMIDEWNNDCPYDFKNIQFNRGVYDGGGIAPDGDEDMNFHLFTFSFRTEDNEIIDTSIFGNNGRLLNDELQITGVYGNIIGQYMMYDYSIESPTKTSQRLNDIVFYSHYDYDGGAYYGCYSNSFGNNCNSNSFGNNCYSNSFGNNCGYNSFGNNCYSNSFGNGCYSNSFGNDCYSNSFGSDCYSNSFGNNCGYNSFGNNCYSNSFGNDCYSNSFGSDCNSNSFGNNCYSNSFGNGCYSNSFGNDCYSNSFGINCGYNSFEDNDGIAELVRYTRLDDGVYSIRFYHDNSKGDYQSLQNHHICRGVHHTSVELHDSRDYETTYAMTSNGGIREFVLADLKAS